MALKWFCDQSGIEVFMAPPYVIKTDKDGKPVTKKIKTMNAEGELVVSEVAHVIYSKPKAYIIRLSVGDEVIQRVLCEDELNKVKAKLKDAWNVLEGLKP
jgi:hypothetical protein